MHEGKDVSERSDTFLRCYFFQILLDSLVTTNFDGQETEERLRVHTAYRLERFDFIYQTTALA